MKLGFWVAMASLGAFTANAQSILTEPPAQPDSNAKYLFYMHGKDGDDGRNVGLYKDIARALADRGFVVISEIPRQSGLLRKYPDDHERYAKKVAGEVSKLVAAGVPASNITVSGYSRGGTLAVMASGFVGRTDVNFVVLAGCVSETGAYKAAYSSFLADYAKKLNGRILSIRDAADPDFGSCNAFFAEASALKEAQEVVLKPGKGHTAFHFATDDWVLPIVQWAGAGAKK